MKKKIKSMALVLVGAVCLVGAGYAAWGNPIVANTALNSGHWEVVLENDVEGHSLAASDVVGYYKGDNSTLATLNPNPVLNTKYGTKDATTISGGAPSIEGDDYVYTIAPTLSSDLLTANFSFYNLHPGTKAITTYEIRNKGSIPAKVGKVTVTLTDEAGNAIAAGSELQKLANSMVVTGNISKHYSSNPSGSDGSVDLPAGTTLANLEANLTSLLVKDSWQLDPKTQKGVNILDSDEMEVNDFAFAIPMNALKGANGENQGMDQKLKVKIQYDFVQYNEIVEQ